MRPRNLVRNEEIERVVKLARDLGITVTGIDVRIDGVTILPATNLKPETSYEKWKASRKDKASDRLAHS